MRGAVEETIAAYRTALVAAPLPNPAALRNHRAASVASTGMLSPELYITPRE